MQKLDAGTQAALRAFGATVRTERHRRGISQERLAELADVHATYIGKVERAEKNISFENILRIARAMKLEISQLFLRAKL